jgi:hypothetical protein
LLSPCVCHSASMPMIVVVMMAKSSSNSSKTQSTFNRIASLFFTSHIVSRFMCQLIYGILAPEYSTPMVRAKVDMLRYPRGGVPSVP